KKQNVVGGVGVDMPRVGTDEGAIQAERHEWAPRDQQGDAGVEVDDEKEGLELKQGVEAGLAVDAERTGRRDQFEMRPDLRGIRGKRHVGIEAQLRVIAGRERER